MTAITLLDGAIGQELVRRTEDRATPLWSTQVMIDRPGLVGEVHADYFRAGATVATTNTYALHRSRLIRVGLQDRLAELVEVALEQAGRARDTHGGRVAGALGPLLASYRPDLKPDPVDAARQYADLVALMRDRVDVFLIETVSSLLEAEGTLSGTRGCGKPVWLALSVMDEDGTRLRSGEPLADIAQLLQDFRPDALLINCCRPEAVPAAVEILAGFGKPFGAYANGFTRISEGFLTDAPTVDALERRTDLDPGTYADHAMGWVAQGATIVGGCCEIGPAHIRELATRLQTAGHHIV
ncbi:homocysteine S-methyltransferase [Cribrihabitans marinus]|uniref:Homocysteine S-methyltransferase n=1 Tax=Cribrihabitans marinus TaxID=1227549 RepID=A0A1H6XNN9_9RHOB|nr:homocysteine S-methyltransferase family protein [Cribrihabitans marinus]GGH27774.1 homocysteine S-methyltransferase [Cribrihabitans marinus]SEJ30683.1 homocysteine S-methyltransferase [Cribrihabitans marinus]